MANLNDALHQLRQERKQAQTQIAKLDQAILAIEGMVGNNSRGGRHARRSLSAAARKRISAAQRARWARTRRKGTASAGRAKSARRPLSVVARRRIAAAQKERWARFREKQQKAAA